MKKEKIKSFNGDEITTFLWEDVKKPKAVMLIAHGMCEHSLRYDQFANFMNNNGIIVFSLDLRGHGETAGSPERVCKYPTTTIMEDSIKDLMFFADYLIKKYNLPLVALGHSYGSFLMQGFLESYNKQVCTVLIGSAFMRDATTVLGGVVSSLTKFFKGGDAEAKMIVALSFDSYGKGFPYKNWLTRDMEIFKAYNDDPYCGNKPSANFYKSMFKTLKKITNKTELAKIPSASPILITSGEKDPVGGKNISLTKKLFNKYKETGLNLTELKTWQDCRHEVLNETNKEEIFEYILNFINKNIK